MDQLDIYRQNSYIDTYDPAYKDDLYTNTATNTEFPETVNHTDSDYLIQSSNTSRYERHLQQQRSVNNQPKESNSSSYIDLVNMPAPATHQNEEEAFSFRRHGHNGNTTPL